MNNLTTQKTPYDFGRSIFMPFQSGAGSVGFVFKSALFYAVMMTALLFLFGKLMMGSFVEFMQFAIEMEADPSSGGDEMAAVRQMLGIMGKMFLPIILMFAGGFVIWAMVEAALFRRIFRADEDETFASPFPWRLGQDELRVMFCRLIVGLAGTAVFILLYFVLIVVIVGAVAGGSQSGALGAIIGLLGFLGVVAAFALFVFITIRLAPASALSIVEDRFALGETWPVTKGRFWPMLGSYAVIAVAGMIISQVLQMILMMAFMGTIMSMVSEVEKVGGMQPDESIAQIIDMLTQPSMLAGMAVALLLYYIFEALWYMHFAGVSAHAVNLYQTDQSENSFEVFD
ncbi:MAG: hypothetical protein L3J05_07445 [Robiginitomaculum sp.]|nr:hypothetical protein [Robiginitomaculum sp.]